jgi:hypothetical protein
LVWPCMVVFGRVWSYMVVYGRAWLCVVAIRISPACHSSTFPAAAAARLPARLPSLVSSYPKYIHVLYASMHV